MKYLPCSIMVIESGVEFICHVFRSAHDYMGAGVTYVL